MLFKQNKKVTQYLTKSFGSIKDEYFNFNLIEQYFIRKNNSEASQVLSDKTCNDLDFDELFMFVDRTTSKVGQQYLYNKLRTIPENVANNKELENIIIELSSNTEKRLTTQKHLHKLSKKGSYYIYSLFLEDHLRPPKWFFVIRILSISSLISLILSFVIPQFAFVLLALFILSMGFHYWNKKNLFQYWESIPQLLTLNKTAKELYTYDAFNKLQPELLQSTAEIDKVKRKMWLIDFSSRQEGDIEMLAWAIVELIKIMFLLEPQLLFDALKRLDNKRKHIEQVFNFVGKVDSLVSIASLRKGLEGEYCIPTISKNGNNIIARDIYHPLIEECVKNTIEIKDKSILLTGSNMSGKTSFIRTIGVNVLTGLTLNTCFAKEMKIPQTHIYSAIRISDDLMNSKSYYFEEVLTIKEMIESGSNGVANLFLLDEIYKGTNTVERISAGKAVLSSLAKNNIVFVSTHDIELTDLLNEQYELYHFSETVDDKSVDFDYKLKKGKLKNRNAIRILQLNQYPEHIILDAINTSKVLDNELPSNGFSKLN